MWPFKRKLKIVSPFGDMKTGCWMARILRPMAELHKRGHRVHLDNGHNFIPTERRWGIFKRWDIVLINNLISSPEEVAVRDATVLKSEAWEEMFAAFRKGGAKIVYDTDDAQDIIPDHIVNREVYDETKKSFLTLLRNADLVTTTTPTIAAYLQAKTDKTVTVIPNCLDLSQFPPRQRSDTLRIGFVGSPSHSKDLAMVIPAIRRLKAKYDFQFVVMGLPNDLGKWIRPVSAWEYPKKIAELGLDIALAPLEDTLFNRNKSCIKFYEMAAVGTLLIASNVSPYKDEMKPEWRTDNDKWYKKLEELILSKDLREKMQKDQSDWVREHRDIAKEYVRWEKTYKKII